MADHPTFGVKTRFFICILGILATAFAANDKILGRACGTTSPEVHVLVIDSRTNVPVRNASITFHSQRDLALIAMIEHMRRSPIKNTPASPPGVVAVTDSEGHATLRCTFAYSEPAFASGGKRTEIYPDGRFHAVCFGYSDCVLEAEAALPGAPYLEALPQVVIKMKKQPNKLPLSTPARVTSAADAPVVPPSGAAGQ